MSTHLQGLICHRLGVQGDRGSGWDHQTSLLRDATWHSEHEAHEPRCPGIAQVPFHHPKFINVSSAGDRKTFSKNISSTKRSRESPFERILSHQGLLLGSVPLILPVPNADVLPITQKRVPGLREQSRAGEKGGRVFSREPPMSVG